MTAGEAFGVVPYGLETMGTMRIEKGHVAGPELDGRTTPADLGLGRMQSRTKPHVGAALRDREGLTDPDRPVLVGLKPVDTKKRLRAGAHLVAEGAAATQEHDAGHVTSIAFSPTRRQHHRPRLPCPRRRASRQPRRCGLSLEAGAGDGRGLPALLHRSQGGADAWLSP